MKKKVLIIGSVKLPIPAVKGGAVPNLIEELVAQQQIENQIELSICSLWDNAAVEESKKYSSTSFIWAKVPGFVKNADSAIRWLLKNVFRIDRILSLGFVTQIIWYTLFVSKVLSKENYDIVIFENSVQMLLSLKFRGNNKRYDNKYYIHMHSVPRKYNGAKKEFEKAKGIICISNYVAKSILSDSRIKINPSQIKIMYNCINTDLFHSLEENEILTLKEELRIDKDDRLIVFAGRLCKDKGIEELLQSLKYIDRENIKLIVVGSNFYNSGIVSPYEEKLQKLSTDIKDRIIFTGYIEYSKMPSIYGMADVVVLPSMWEEPAGMTIIEAMACGKAVITTISGGIPEYTGNNSCILLERDDRIIERIAKEINRILDDMEYRNRIEARSIERASKYCSAFYYSQFIDIIGVHQ